VRGRIEQVLGALTEANVRYLVVGGVAVVLHGYLRTTLDLDLVLHLEHENLEKALTVFNDLGFQPQVPVPLRSFADLSTRENWAREKNMTVFSIWDPDHPGFAIDLFIREPFDFEAVYNRALVVPLHGARATVISLADLIEMKRSAGRPQDQSDIEALSQLTQEKREASGE
jgi:predicted nucleotidyltransferase